MDYVGHDVVQQTEEQDTENLPPQILSVVSIPNPVGNNASVTIEAYVVDDYGVDAVFSSLGEESVQSVSMDASAAPLYVVTYDASTLPFGENIFSLLAVDTAGQQSSADGSFTVNNVTSTLIEDIAVSPDLISTADLAVPVTVTLTATDSFYDSSALGGSCSLQDIDLGTLVYNDTNKIHELSFLPEEIGVTSRDLGEFLVDCNITNPAGYSVTDEATFTIYDGIPPELSCSVTQDGKNDGSADLEITCQAKDEYLLSTVSWNESTLGADAFINTSGDTWIADIAVANVPADTYTLAIIAEDAQKNTTSITLDAVVHDAQEPTVTFCTLSDYSISNEEGTTTTITCAGVTDETENDLTVTFDTDFTSGSLTSSGSGTYTGMITVPADTSADDYSVSVEISDGTNATAYTLSTLLTLEDRTAPELSCSVTQDGKNDGSADIAISCTATDETLLDYLEYSESTIGSDILTNIGGDAFETNIPVEGIAAGEYSITVVAYDAEGNDTPVTITGKITDTKAPDVGLCTLSDYSISNEEGTTTTITCAGVTDETENDLTVTFDTDFTSGSLTSSGSGTYTGMITVPADTSADDYSVSVEISDGTNATAYTLSTLLTLEDRTAPELSCSVTQDGKNDGSADIAISCTATDETSLSYVEANESTLGSVTLTNISGDTFVGNFDVTGIPAGVYSITATAYDTTGNNTANAVSGIVTDVLDPTITCSLSETAITNNTSTGTYPLSTTFACTAVDESSISGVEYDAGVLGSGAMIESGSNYSVTISASGEAAGNYPVIGTVTDGTGHTTTTSKTVSVVDETAPTFTAVSVSPNSVMNDGTETFTIDACVVDETDGTAVGNGVAVAIDSYANALTYNSGTTCHSITINGDEFSNGTYTTKLTATDAAGNSAEDTGGSISIESDSYTTLSTDIDTRTSEEAPTTNYNSSPLYVGASSSGRGRSYVSFDSTVFEGTEITSALLTIYAVGGTCHSSSNNHDCNHDLVVEAHELSSSWNAATLTWNSAPSYDSSVVDSVTMNEAYGGGGSYTFDVTSLVQTWADGTNYGVLLKADGTGESTSNQVDVSIGSYETGLPAMLEVTYSVK